MANQDRVTVRLNEKAVQRLLLKSRDAQRVLKKVAQEIADETEAKYKNAGKEYTFKVVSGPQNDRARMLIVSNDGDHARYSEAARGYLLESLHKKREI
jgi:hypothetical protein